MATQTRTLALTLVATVALAACGGGGGGGGGGSVIAPAASTLSGTAAGGAAVIGTVIVTDSLGATKGSTIEANGKYTVDVSGMTGPFMLKASGTIGNSGVTYYSAATSSDVNGTVNVTPFTNLMVSNIAAQLAENYFATPQHANFATLFTPAHLAAAQTALLAKLQPVLAALGVSSSIDLLRASFAADHSGLDAVMDMVKVEADTATNIVTIKNAISGGVIATDNATTSADDAIPVSGPLTGITPTAATDLQAITAQLNKLATLFATGLPTIEAITANDVFDTTSAFLDGGRTYAQFATMLSTNGSNVGLQFSNVAITLDGSGTSATITALVTSAGGGNVVNLKMAKVGGVWKAQGDGKIASISAKASAELQNYEYFNNALQVVSPSASNPMYSGIYFHINPQSYNASHAGASTQIATALITGPGLPAGGVVFEANNSTDSMQMNNGLWTEDKVTECGKPIVNSGYTPDAAHCINIAAAVDNSEYTVLLKNAAGTALNGTGYKVILPKQPRLTDSLTLADFPTVTNVSIDGNTNVTPRSMTSGKSLVVGWTLPVGMSTNYAHVWTSDSTKGQQYFVSKNLTATATSTILALETAPSVIPDTAQLRIQAKDTFGRNFGVSHYQKIYTNLQPGMFGGGSSSGSAPTN